MCLTGQISDLRGLKGDKLTNEQTEEQIKVPMFYKTLSPSKLLPKKLKKNVTDA